MTIEKFRELALSFPGTIEQAHFDKAAFKVLKKRIFATMDEGTEVANIKLSESDQSAFCSLGKKSVYPVQNKWGLQGWTTFEFTTLPEELVKDALDTAYNEVFKPGRRGK